MIEERSFSTWQVNKKFHVVDNAPVGGFLLLVSVSLRAIKTIIGYVEVSWASVQLVFVWDKFCGTFMDPACMIVRPIFSNKDNTCVRTGYGTVILLGR